MHQSVIQSMHAIKSGFPRCRYSQHAEQCRQRFCKLQDSAVLHAGRCKSVTHCAKCQTAKVLIPQREHAMTRQCRWPSMQHGSSHAACSNYAGRHGIHAAYSNHHGPCRHPCCTKLSILCKAAGFPRECVAGAGIHETGWACHTKQAYVINNEHNRRGTQDGCPRWSEQECRTER